MLNKIRQARQGLGMEDDTNNPEAVPGAGGSNGSAAGGSAVAVPDSTKFDFGDTVCLQECRDLLLEVIP